MRRELTVYFADDHTLFRRGMTRLLESFESIHQIKEAENGKKLIELVRKDPPDVVLLDIRMPIMDGFDTCTFLSRYFPEVKVIILSMEDSEEIITDLVQRGAKGFLSKSSEPEEVELAIQTVSENDYFYNYYIHADLIDQIFNGISKSKFQGNSRLKLTSRELEILHLTSEQLSMREIASRLFISERTVHNHRRNIMAKLGVKNSAGLIRFAIVNQVFFSSK